MKTMLKTVLLAVMVLVPSMAVAQEGVACTTDADCPAGQACIATPCACACPECAPGQECPPCDCGECDGGSVCMPEDVGGWMADECTTDADCPTGFVCEETEFGSCGGSGGAMACPPCTCAACDPDDPTCVPEECECPPCEQEDPFPPDCTTETVTLCVFKPAECASDADCAEGFECLDQEMCSGGTTCACAGCACPDCPPGEECPPCDCPTDPEPCDCPDAEEPTCESMGSFCVPKQIECAATTDCPEGWECGMFGGDCACPACACAVPDCKDGEDCPVPEDCECAPCDCADATSGYCVPGGWMEAGFQDASTMGSAEFMSDGVTKAATEDTGGAPEAPVDQGNGNEETTDGTTDEGGSSGCSATTVPSAAAALVMLLAVLSLATLRRRESL